MDKLEIVRSIVVTSLEQGFILKGKTTIENAEKIAEFYKTIYQAVTGDQS